MACGRRPSALLKGDAGSILVLVQAERAQLEGQDGREPGRGRLHLLTLSFFCSLQQTWQEKERGIAAETGKCAALALLTLSSSSSSPSSPLPPPPLPSSLPPPPLFFLLLPFSSFSSSPSPLLLLHQTSHHMQAANRGQQQLLCFLLVPLTFWL